MSIDTRTFYVFCSFAFQVLYRYGPNYNHADHCLSIENFWRHSTCSWSFVAGLNRACLNAGKTLLITRVDLSHISSNHIETFLEQTHVRTMEIQRWIPQTNSQ
jgi:GTP:adenosylcobinamide-phosphate guanylyltransferase